MNEIPKQRERKQKGYITIDLIIQKRIEKREKEKNHIHIE